MSGPESGEKGNPESSAARPITDQLVTLKQAANMLRMVEELGRIDDFYDDTSQIVDVLGVARRLIEEAIAAFTAYIAAQGGAT